MLKTIIKDPLTHFLAIGLGLFLLYSIVAPDDTDTRIVVDEYDINELIAKWNLQWQREPTEDELKGLLDEYIKQEIYYREALSMNLDHNDEIIKRRMAQKIKFLTQDIAENSEPSDEELEQYLRENQASYMSERRVTFSHVFFSPDRRVDAEQDALNSLQSANPQGDRSPVKLDFIQAPLFRIRSELGFEFAAALSSLEAGEKWQGPIESGFGFHLVKITEVDPERPNTLEEVRAQVINDYQYAMQQEINDDLFDGLLEKYEIILDFENGPDSDLLK